MSWDKYNEARKKAKQAQSKLDKASDTVDKLTGKSSKKLTKSEINQAKTAAKNAKSNKWLFAIWAIITIAALVSLLFTSTIEPVVNNWIYGDRSTTTAGDDRGAVGSFADVVTNSDLKIHYVFVGQGDCILIDLPDGKNVIIDSGSETYNSETSQKVISYIDTYLLDDGEIIDYMILTHPDSDHLFYLPDILDTYEVANIYRPYTFFVSDGKDSNQRLDPDGTIATAEEQAAVEAKEREAVAELNSEYGYGIEIGDPTKNTTNAKSTDIMYKFISRIYTETYGEDNTPAEIHYSIAGATISGTDYTFTFYAPVNPSEVYGSWNNYSSVIVLDYNDTKIAFTGDAEKEAENEILANQTNLPLPDVDIMDMGHHGSRTSSQDAFVKALKPEYAIISCGIDNKYGHPNQETIDTLYNNGVDSSHIFITAQSGDIVIGFGYTGTISTDTSTDNTEIDTSGTTDDSADTDTSGTNTNENTETTTTENTNIITSTNIESEILLDVDQTPTTLDYIIAYTGEASVVAPTTTEPIEIKWWYIVVGIIVISGVVLLIIAPSIVKSLKKKK